MFSGFSLSQKTSISFQLTLRDLTWFEVSPFSGGLSPAKTQYEDVHDCDEDDYNVDELINSDFLFSKIIYMSNSLQRIE